MTGIGLKGEAAGLVPDADWKQRHWREPWYVGDTVNMSIGQGFITATPLQMAVVTAAVANGGWRVRPLLSQQVIPESAVPLRQKVGLSPATLEILQQGLRDVVVYGTGGNANLGPGFPLPPAKPALPRIRRGALTPGLSAMRPPTGPNWWSWSFWKTVAAGVDPGQPRSSAR